MTCRIQQKCTVAFLALSSHILCFALAWSWAVADESVGQAAPEKKKKAKWVDLFDGKSLAGWKKTKFGGEGEVSVKDGNLILDFGYSMTGVTYTKPVPKCDYEIRLEAMRDDGSDFFCTLTFPVGDSHCSFVVGGWGGGVTGLSSIDGMDASENETTDYMQFKNKKWYRIRVRVTKEQIQAWVDDDQKVDQDIADRKVSTRIEVDLCKPLGFASWETRGVLRKIQLRELDRADIKAKSP